MSVGLILYWEGGDRASFGFALANKSFGLWIVSFLDLLVATTATTGSEQKKQARIRVATVDEYCIIVNTLQHIISIFLPLVIQKKS